MRLKEDSQQSMLFDFGNNRNGNVLAKSSASGEWIGGRGATQGNKGIIHPNQVQIDVRKSANNMMGGGGNVVRPGSS